MKEKVFYTFVLVFIIVVLVFLGRVNQLKKQTKVIEEIASTVEKKSILTRIELSSTSDSIKKDIQRDMNTIFAKQADSILTLKLDVFQRRIKELSEEIAVENKRLAEIQNQQERELNGLPSHRDLDDLDEYYQKRLEGKSNSSNSYGIYGADDVVVSFNTERGKISFFKDNFTFGRIPSTGQVAWIRIKKFNSVANSELIKAWLNESAEVKQSQGYKLISDETYAADYGEITEKIYKNDDAYFKTYYQYQRVQGTYGRHSMKYTFYTEVGSELRKEQFQLEEYNEKLGS